MIKKNYILFIPFIIMGSCNYFSEKSVKSGSDMNDYSYRVINTDSIWILKKVISPWTISDSNVSKRIELTMKNGVMKVFMNNDIICTSKYHKLKKQFEIIGDYLIESQCNAFPLFYSIHFSDSLVYIYSNADDEQYYEFELKK